MYPDSHHQRKIRQRPETQRHIRLQIYLPLLFGSLLIVGLAIFILLEDRSPGAFADVALICLGLPILLVGIIMMVVLALGVIASEKVIQKLPAPFRSADQLLGRLERTAKRTGDMAARPMIYSLSAWAGVKAVFQSISAIFRSDEEKFYE
jgi:hypothetical protein